MTSHTTTAKPLLAAYAREPLPHPPVWLMRQAGRYLPEYQELRRSAGGFLAMAQNPELAAEVTLQPVRRFDVDAAILFSDILLPLQAMGMPLRFDEGRGPVLPEALDSRARIEALRPLDPAADLAYVGDALRLVRAGLSDDKTLLGFCGAPYTLACYAVEGGHAKSHARLRTLMHRDAPLFDELMGKLADAVGAHLLYQLEAGADAVVLFDTWAGTLCREDYIKRVLPFTRRALEPVLGRAPVMAFVLDGAHVLDAVVDTGVNAVAIDWRMDLADVLDRYGDRVAVQGNLDPGLLLSTPADVHARTTALLQRVAGRPGHVLALGHGVIKETDPECVAAFVAAARGETSW
ncbi:MAG: uroporphyrinogen decarboxylase [Planctomycetota bacterium]|nr:MAG: uroporphyrinogen decarboxylase [Planctomycetota bacterium]